MHVCLHLGILYTQQWRIQDFEKEGARPRFLGEGGGAPQMLRLNWGVKMTNKLLTTGQTEGARAPAPL